MRCFIQTLCFLSTIAAAFLFPTLSSAAGPAAQSFNYQVNWGLMGRVGTIQVQTADFSGDPTPPKASVEIRTYGLARVLYPFTSRSEAIFDPATRRLLSANSLIKLRSTENLTRIEFDYDNAVARYIDKNNPKKNATLPFADAPPEDLIASLLRAREYDLKPGDAKTISVFFENAFYELRLRAWDYETVSSIGGKVRALKVIPEPIGTPKGMFRKGGSLTVWLADDAERLPIRIEVKLKIGTAVALLDRQPPASQNG